MHRPGPLACPAAHCSPPLRAPPFCRHANAFVTNLNAQVLTRCPELDGKSLLQLVTAVGAKCNSWSERRVRQGLRKGGQRSEQG